MEGIEDLSGIRVKLLQKIGQYELSLFTGWVDECPLQSDRQSRTITAYDAFYYYGNCNVSEWYNSLSFPVDIRVFLTSLLDFVGIPYADSLEVRNQFDVNKTLETVSMDFISVIKSICQAVGGFGIINPDGEFDIVYLTNQVSEQTLTAMSGFELEPYIVKPVDRVVVRSEETDIGGSYGEGNNAYIVQGNFLCFGMSADSIQEVATGLYANVAGFSWKPCIFHLGISNPLIGCDGILYKVVTSQGDEFETYLFNSYLCGVQMFDQELESFGTEYREEVIADDYTNNFILAYRVMKLKATVDGFDLQIEGKVGEDEVITKINASAEKVAISSEKIDIAGLVKFINEDNRDETLIDGGKLKNKSISTEKLDVKNLDSICANIGGFTIKDGKIVFLESSSYQDLNSGEDRMSYWYSFGINPESYIKGNKVIWFGAHPDIVGSGINEDGCYAEDALVYPFYITADGKIISNGEENEIIWGSGKSYQVSQLPGTTNLNWNVQSSVQYGQESLQIASGYILFNDITRINSSGIKCNDVNVLDFTDNGIYSADINSEIVKAKKSVITTKLLCEEIDASTVRSANDVIANYGTTEQVSLLTIAKTVASKQAAITGAATTVTSRNLTASKALYSDENGKIAASSSVTSTELSYLDGVTSAIQAQLNGKQSTINGGASTITSSNLTASRALISNGNGKVAVSAVTSTELGYLDGVTSAIQTQLNGKQASISGSANASNGYLRIPGLKIQIAWKRVSWSGPIATAWGSGYETASAISLGNWAASFASAPAVTYAVNSSTGTDVGITGYATPSTTSAGSVYLQRNTSLSTSRTYTIHVLAIGTYS